MIVRWIRRAIALAALIAGLSVVTGAPAGATALCGRVTVWGAQPTVCVPAP